tara:strand:- start:855 stop:1037 length:183 start_codon:yes stop_codon:yes gene_type:complete
MSLKKEMKSIEKGMKKEIRQVETWMYERRKFFIKLGFIAIVVGTLLIFSHFYLRASGVGI